MENIKKRLNLKVPAKASMWYTASAVVAKGISALSTPVFTRLLTPEEYGLYPLYNTWLAVAAILLTLELTGGVIYRGLQKFEDNKDEFLSSTLGLFLTIFITFCALYFAISDFINSITGLSTFITALMFTEIFANTVISFYSAKARYEYRYKSAIALNLIGALGIPLVSVILILLTKFRSEARIIGSCIVLSIIGVFALYKIVSSSHTLYKKKVWLFLLKFNIPLLPHYLSVSLIMRIGDIVIGRTYGTEELGKYSVAVSIGMALTVVTGGLLSALSPWLLRKIRAAKGGEMRELLLLVTKGLCVLCLFVLAAAPELLTILTPPSFYSALPAIYPLTLSIIPIFLVSAISSAEMYYEKSYITALPSIISAAVSIALSLYVLPKVDYRFAGVLVLISYLILATLSALVYKHLSGELPIKVKPTLTAFLLTALYAVPIFLFRNVFLSRIVLALPLLPVLYILGKQVYGKIKEE